jgi:DNA recombination protein RmuC
LALEDKADEIRDLLGVTQAEMLKMDDVLARLARQAGAFSFTIERARLRTRAIGGKLRGLGVPSLEIAEDAAQIDEGDEAT